MAHILEKTWETGAGYQAACLIILFGDKKGHRCGYVGVPPEHPLHRIGYGEQTEVITAEMAGASTLGQKSPILAFTATVRSDCGECVRRSPDIILDCHGGLTYSSDEPGEDYPLASDNLWWFGFDCGHSGDGCIDPEASFGPSGVVRSQQFVIEQCESLADQLKALE